MVGTNASTNENHKLYNSKVQDISIWGGECSKTVVSLCAHFVDTVAPVKIKAENGISKSLDFWGKTIDVYDQEVFTLKDSGFHDEEVKKKMQATCSQKTRSYQVIFCLS